jgi:Tfp pilus assembly protein FimT
MNNAGAIMRMGIGPHQAAREWKGGYVAHAFAMTDLVIAAGLLTLVSAFSMPMMAGTVQGYRLRTAAWRIAGDLRLARQKAVSLNRRHRLCFSNCGAAVPANGYLIQREGGSGWEVESAARPPSDGVQVTSNATITFAQTGEAGGGTVTLSSGSKTFQVRTHFTGKVTVCNGSCP